MEDDIQMEEDLKWKTTSNRTQPQMEDDLKGKTTSIGRRPQMKDNLKILKVAYLHTLIRSSSNIVFNLRGPNQNLILLKTKKTKIRGYPRGNCECGSAQPSLYKFILLPQATF